MSDADVIKSYSDALRLGIYSRSIEEAYMIEGRLFEVFYTSPSIASGGTFAVGVLTGTRQATYIPATISTSADSVTVELFEGAVVTGGTTLTAWNHNRNLSTVPTSTVKTAPTITTIGTLIAKSYIGGVSGNPQSRQGDMDSGGYKIMLKPNTQYVFRFTNGSTAANVVNVRSEWIESV